MCSSDLEQQQPDDVDEVPVPRDALEPEVVVGPEEPCHAPEEDHRQHDRAHGHVEAVEAREHEEGRAEDPEIGRASCRERV